MTQIKAFKIICKFYFIFTETGNWRVESSLVDRGLGLIKELILRSVVCSGKEFIYCIFSLRVYYR